MARERVMERADAIQRGMLDIGAASRSSGGSVKMIRHYEEIGLLPKVARTLANYRVYSANDVHRLRFIKRSRNLGFSVADIAQLLGLWGNRRRSSASVKAIAGRHIADLEQRVADLQSMLRTLQHLANNCHGNDRPECPILDDLSGEPRPLADRR